MESLDSFRKTFRTLGQKRREHPTFRDSWIEQLSLRYASHKLTNTTTTPSLTQQAMLMFWTEDTLAAKGQCESPCFPTSDMHDVKCFDVSRTVQLDAKKIKGAEVA